MVIDLDDIIEKSIMELFDDFKKNPEYFIDEMNLTYRFHDIINEKDCNGYKFRWEYFTNVLYNEHTPNPNGTPKKIDICFIKNDYSDSIPYALEFKFKRNIFIDGENINEFYPSKFDVVGPDFEEIQHPLNKIDKGYIIFFSFGNIVNNHAREKAHFENKNKFFEKYEQLEKTIKNDSIKIIFACVDNIDGKRTSTIMHNLNNAFPEVLDEKLYKIPEGN